MNCKDCFGAADLQCTDCPKHPKEYANMQFNKPFENAPDFVKKHLHTDLSNDSDFTSINRRILKND